MNQSHAEEQRLLKLIASGDQGALDQLYTRYHVRLAHYLLLRLGHNVEWAEDVLQEVFLSIWYSARSYQPQNGSPATWIFGIVHHQLAKAYRSRSRHSAVCTASTEMLDDVEHVTQGNSEDAIISRLMLADAFARLSAKHREILELVFYQGFTFEECARILNVPVGTIKSRMSYARRALVQVFERSAQEG